MICIKCNQSGILNQANGNSFYYCRTCKEEILLQQVDSLTVGTTATELLKVSDILDYYYYKSCFGYGMNCNCDTLGF